ncbi:MAG: sodium-dependent transporter [Methanoregula sp.]|nr:sodium-dependent transporter [Methanoregula sp.]
MERWSSHIGFILAAVGAAVGIGNIWRFSAVIGQNGGGAYLIPYFIAVFVFALPLMILEITMGRRFRGTVVSSFRAVRPEFRFIGWFLCGIVFLILSYYLVITGWTIAYTVFSVTGDTVTFSGFTGSYQPVLFAILAVLLTGIIVSAGVRKGIERISIILIPVCIIILVILALYCVTLPGFSEAIRFLFTPDFSVLTHPDLWIAAFGQAFFSLSVGEGILLTYGSYMAKEQDIPGAALIITIADLFVALLAGAVIFPIVFSYGLSPTIGAELAFTTLPIAFSLMPAGQLFAIAFFAVLFFAALTSAVAMLEVCVAAVEEAAGWTRRKATSVLTGILCIVTLLPALSYSTMRLSFDGIPLLDLMDDTVGTLGLHIVAILLAIVFTWFLPQDEFWSELGKATRLKRIIFFLCKYVIPAALLLTIVVQLITGMTVPGTSFIPGTQYIGSVLQIEGVALFALLIFVVYIIVRNLRK